MPTQKTFKHRVRTRMAKTGESYTAARRHLLSKTASAPSAEVLETAQLVEAVPDDARGVSESSMIRATGHDHAKWFRSLDAWDATAHTHTEIARWLGEVHGVPPWWTQSITVAYERARGMRTRHQMADGFSVSVTRTIAVAPAAVLEAFTDPTHRASWLGEAVVTPRPTRARLTARFDWADPVSRVVVTVAAKDDGRSLLAVAHERLPDAETGEHMKASCEPGSTTSRRCSKRADPATEIRGDGRVRDADPTIDPGAPALRSRGPRIPA